MIQTDAAILVVFLLSGAAVAVGMLYAPTLGTVALWCAALVPWVGILVWRGASPLWLAGLSAGLLAGLATGIIHATFQSVLLANHPADAAAYAGQSSLRIGARLLGFALVAGAAWGLLAAGLAWVVGKAL